MKNKLTTSEIEARFAEINALEPETPTQDDLDAIARANAESPGDTVTLEEYKAQREYSGRLLLLHCHPDFLCRRCVPDAHQCLFDDS